MPKHRVVPIVKLAKSEWSENVKIDSKLIHNLEKDKSYKQLQKMAIQLGIDHHISKSYLAMCIIAQRNIFFPQETGYVNKTLVHMVKQLTNYSTPQLLTNSKLRSLLTRASSHTSSENMGNYLLRVSRLYENILFTEESWCSEQVRELISAQQNGTSLQSYIRFMISRNLELFEAWKVEQNFAKKQIMSEEMEIRRENLDKATEQYLSIIKSYCSTGCTVVPKEMKKWAKKPRFKTTLIVCNTSKQSQNLKFALGQTFANGFTIDKIIEKKHIVWLGLGKFFIAGAYWTSDKESDEDEEEKESKNNGNDYPPDEDPQIIQMPPGFVVASESPMIHKIAIPESVGIMQPLTIANALQYYEQQPAGIAMAFQTQQPMSQTIDQVPTPKYDTLLTDLKTTALTLVKEGLQFSAEQLLQFVMHVASLQTHHSIMNAIDGPSIIVPQAPQAPQNAEVEITLVTHEPLSTHLQPIGQVQHVRANTREIQPVGELQHLDRFTIPNVKPHQVEERILISRKQEIDAIAKQREYARQQEEIFRNRENSKIELQHQNMRWSDSKAQQRNYEEKIREQNEQRRQEEELLAIAKQREYDAKQQEERILISRKQEIDAIAKQREYARQQEEIFRNRENSKVELQHQNMRWSDSKAQQRNYEEKIREQDEQRRQEEELLAIAKQREYDAKQQEERILISKKQEIDAIAKQRQYARQQEEMFRNRENSKVELQHQNMRWSDSKAQQRNYEEKIREQNEQRNYEEKIREELERRKQEQELLAISKQREYAAKQQEDLLRKQRQLEASLKDQELRNNYRLQQEHFNQENQIVLENEQRLQEQGNQIEMQNKQRKQEQELLAIAKQREYVAKQQEELFRKQRQLEASLKDQELRNNYQLQQEHFNQENQIILENEQRLQEQGNQIEMQNEQRKQEQELLAITKQREYAAKQQEDLLRKQRQLEASLKDQELRNNYQLQQEHFNQENQIILENEQKLQEQGNQIEMQNEQRKQEQELLAITKQREYVAKQQEELFKKQKQLEASLKDQELRNNYQLQQEHFNQEFQRNRGQQIGFRFGAFQSEEPEISNQNVFPLTINDNKSQSEMNREPSTTLETKQDELHFKVAQQKINEILLQQKLLAQQQMELAQENEKLLSMEELQKLVQEHNFLFDQQHKLDLSLTEIELDYESNKIDEHSKIAQELDTATGIKSRVMEQKRAALEKSRNEAERQTMLNQIEQEKLQLNKLVTDFTNQMLFVSKNIQISMDLTLESIAKENAKRMEDKRMELIELELIQQKLQEEKMREKEQAKIQKEYEQKLAESKLVEERLTANKLRLQQKQKILSDAFSQRTGQSLVAMSEVVTLQQLDRFTIRKPPVTVLQEEKQLQNTRKKLNQIWNQKMRNTNSLIQRQELQRYQIQETFEKMLQRELQSKLVTTNAFRVLEPDLSILPFVLSSPNPIKNIPHWVIERSIKELDELKRMYNQDEEVDNLKMALLRGISELSSNNVYRINVKDDDYFHAAANIVHYIRNQKSYNPQTLEFFGQILNSIHEHKSIEIDPSVKMRIFSGDLKEMYTLMKALVDHQTHSLQRKASDPIIQVMKEMTSIMPKNPLSSIGFFPDFMFLITDTTHTRLVDTGSQTIIAIDAVAHNPDPQLAALQSLLAQTVDIPVIVTQMITDNPPVKMDSMVSRLWESFQSMGGGLPNYHHIVQALSMAHYVSKTVEANIVLPVVSMVTFQFDSLVLLSSSTIPNYLVETRSKLQDKLEQLQQLAIMDEKTTSDDSDLSIEIMREMVISFMDIGWVQWENFVQHASKLPNWKFNNPFGVQTQVVEIQPITEVSLLETTLNKYSQIYDPLNGDQFNSTFLVIHDKTNQVIMTPPTIALDPIVVVNPFTIDVENMFLPNDNPISTNANIWGISSVLQQDANNMEIAIQSLYRYESSQFLEKALNTNKIYPSTAFGMSHVRLSTADKLFHEISQSVVGQITAQSRTHVRELYSDVISNAFQASQVSDSFIKDLVDVPILYKPMANRIRLALTLLDEISMQYVDQLKTFAVVRNKSQNPANLVAPINKDELFSNSYKDIPHKMQNPQNYAWEITIDENGNRVFWVRDTDQLTLQVSSFTNKQDVSYSVTKGIFALLTTDKLTNQNWNDPDEILMRIDEIVGFAQVLNWDNPTTLSQLISSVFSSQELPTINVHNRVLQRFQKHDDIMEQIMISNVVVHPGAHMLHLLNAQDGNKHNNLLHLVNEVGVNKAAKHVDEWMKNENPEVAKKLSESFPKWNPIVSAALKMATWAQLATTTNYKELTSEEYFKLQPRTTFQAIRDCVSQSLLIPSETMTLENLDTAYKLEAGPMLENMEDIRFIGELSYLIQQMATLHQDKHYTFQLLVNLYLAASPQELTPQLIFNAITTAFTTLENMKLITKNTPQINGAWNQTAINLYNSLQFYANLSPIVDFGNYFDILKGDDVFNVMNTAQEIINIPMSSWRSDTYQIVQQLSVDIIPLRQRFQQALKTDWFRASFRDLIVGFAKTCKLTGCDVHAYMWDALKIAEQEKIQQANREADIFIQNLQAQQAQEMSDRLNLEKQDQEENQIVFDLIKHAKEPNPFQIAVRNVLHRNEEQYSWILSTINTLFSATQTPSHIVDLVLGFYSTGHFGTSFVQSTIQHYLPNQPVFVQVLSQFAGLYILEQYTKTVSFGLSVDDNTFINLTPNDMTTQQKHNLLHPDSIYGFAKGQTVLDQVLFSNLPNNIRTEIISQKDLNIVELFESMSSPELSHQWISGELTIEQMFEFLSSSNIMNSVEFLKTSQILISQDLMQASSIDLLQHLFQQTNEPHIFNGVSTSTIVPAMAEIVTNLQKIRNQIRIVKDFEQVFEAFIELGK